MSTETSRRPAPAAETDGRDPGDQLEVLGGPEDGRICPLEQEVTRIGRQPDCGIVLGLDMTVSRVHAEISWRGGEYVIRDLDSRHGTRVNGERITAPTALRDGAIIEIGDTSLCLCLRIGTREGS